MKTFKFTRLTLAVMFVGGAIAGCDSDYNTKAVNTDSVVQPTGNYVVAELDGSTEAMIQQAQYDEESSDTMTQSQDQEDQTAQSQDSFPESSDESELGSEMEQDEYQSEADSSSEGEQEGEQIVQFDFDSDELSDDAKEKLESFVESMSQEDLASVEISIRGYTDATGPEEYNQDLAQRRAEAVKEFLEEKGFESDNLKVEAVGESEESMAGNASENRRVVVSVESPLGAGEIS